MRIFPLCKCNEYPTTKSLTIESSGIDLDNLYLDKDYTHIFELTSQYNKVVIDYGKQPKLWYLISRNNTNGEYKNFSLDIQNNIPIIFFPKIFEFDSLKDVVDKSKSFSSLSEGFVLYNENYKPILKIKNPDYVIAHRLGSNGISLKDTINLYLDNEHLEYLSYFPSDKSKFDLIEEKLSNFSNDLQSIINSLDYSLSNKEFAFSIKNYPGNIKTFLFLSKKENILSAKELLCNNRIKKSLIFDILYK